MFSTALKVRSLNSKLTKEAADVKDKDKGDKKDSEKKAIRSSEDNEEGRVMSSISRRLHFRGKLGAGRNIRRRLNKKRIAILVLVVLFVVALVGTLGYFFAYVKYTEYYQYGLLKHVPTGQIDRTWVFNNQWVTRGPDWTMLYHPSIAQFVHMDNLSVGTKGELGIHLNISFQYFLRRWDVPDLHDRFLWNYSTPIWNRASDALKETTPQFATEQFLKNRTGIEMALLLALRRRLEGICCFENCGLNHTRPCLSGCKNRLDCTVHDKGVFVEVKYFQLRGVRMPPLLMDAYMAPPLNTLKSQESQFKFEAHFVRATTDYMVAQLMVKAERAKALANIEAKRITSIAKANYSAVVKHARGIALESLCSRLNITSEEFKNSLEYQNILERDETVHMVVDYQPIFGQIVKP